jgi:hypothetical protein
MRIACLHTADSNVAVFDRQVIDSCFSDVELHHVVRADLLAAVEAAGSLIAPVRADAAAALRALAGDYEGVLLTCSTLGPAVEDVKVAAPVMRVDEALAREAVACGGAIVALCAVSTTLRPTTEVFERASTGTSATVAVQIVEGAWNRFKAGDMAGYHALVAAAADDARESGADAVALAQASMAPAAALCSRPPVLGSPGAGLAAIVSAVRRSSGRN